MAWWDALPDAPASPTAAAAPPPEPAAAAPARAPSPAPTVSTVGGGNWWDSLPDAGTAHTSRLSTPAREAPAPDTAGKHTGYLANLAAPITAMAGDILGMPGDILSAAPRAIVEFATGKTPTPEQRAQAEAASPRLIPDPPLPTSRTINELVGRTGLPTPENTVATDSIGRILSATGEGVRFGGEMALGGAGLLRSGMRLPGAVNWLARAASSGGPVLNTAINAGSGFGAGVAQEMFPDHPIIAGLAGGLLGGGAVAGAKAGFDALAPRAGDYLANARSGMRTLTDPAQATAWERNQAAMRLQEAAQEGGGSVAQAVANIDAAPAYLEGSAGPTTYAASENIGIGRLARGLEARNPAPFDARRTANRAAEARALDSIRGTGGATPEGVTEALTGHLQRIDQAAETRIAALTDTARRLNPEGRGAQAIGEDMQTQLSALEEAARKATGRLWKQWEAARGADGEEIAFSIQPARETAGSLRRPPEGAEPPTGREAALYARAEGLPEVVTARTAQNLRQTAGELIRKAIREGDGAVERRVKDFRKALDDAMTSAVARVEGAPPPAAGPAPAPRTAAGAPTLPTTVTTPQGTKVEIRYEVVPGNTLKKATGDLQNRDRSTAANESLVQRVRTQLDTDQLGHAPSPLEGAPVVGPDDIVESGNGRYTGIMAAHADNGEPARRYRAWLESMGHDLTGIDNPILIRRRVTPLDHEARVRFAHESNTPAGQSRPHAELARQDAGRITPEILDLYRGGGIKSADNADFRRAVAAKVFDKADLAQLLTKEGALNMEGERRIMAALSHYAYEHPAILRHFTEAREEGLRALGTALHEAAPEMAGLKAAIESGRVPPEYDLRKAVSDAADIMNHARRGGISIADAAAQMGLFGAHHPLAETLLKAAYGDAMRGRMSAESMADYLRFYAREAGRQTGDAGLFGAAGPTPQEILDAAGQRFSKGARTGTPEPEPAGGTPADNQAKAQTDSAAPAAPAAENLAVTRTENITPEVADLYQRARTSTYNKKTTFDESAVGDAVARDTGATGFKKTPEQVFEMFWSGSARGRQNVAEYLTAGGDIRLLREAAARKLRDAATIRSGALEGTLHPGRVQAWLDRHAGKLDLVPGLREHFRDAAAATRAVEQTAARVEETRREYLAGVARRFVRDQDPVKAVGAVIEAGSTNGPREAAQLLRLAKAHPAGEDAVRAAAVQHIFRKFRTENLIPGAEGATTLRGDSLARYVRENGKTLGILLGDRSRATLEKLAEQIRRENLNTNLRTPGSPNTAHDLLGALQHGGVPFYHVLASGASFGLGHTGSAVLGGLAGYLRMRGMSNIERLLEHAVLDPALGRQLLTRVTPATAPMVARSFMRHLARSGAVGAATGTTRQE